MQSREISPVPAAQDNTLVVQTFTGIAPAGRAGEQFSLDMNSWFILSKIIQRVVDDDDFVFRQVMDETTACQGAIDIREALADDACLGTFRWLLSVDCTYSSREQLQAAVDLHRALLHGYAAFLDTCGGCRWT